MKKVIFVVAAVALTASLGMAQPGGGQRMSREERQKIMKERYAELCKMLELSDEAAVKVDSINLRYDKQLMELMSSRSRGGDREAMRSKMQDIQKARTAEVKALMNDEQAKKYDKWLEEERAKDAARRGGDRR